MNRRTFEREFLKALAAVWLACRFRVMGSDVTGNITPKGDLRWSLLGCSDYAAEMGLLCTEALEHLDAKKGKA
jgi:hypothetical protein